MPYKISNINKAEVEKLITEKADKVDTVMQSFNQKSFKLKRITLPIDQMYYNIRNVRTSIETKEYIKRKNLDSDFFNKGEYHNTKVQEAYHSIIYEAVLDKKQNAYDKKFKVDKESQTEAVYINLDGILINGNSRVSYWRENQIFQTIECLVFCEQYPWEDLLAVVNRMDSSEEIEQKYSWYNRADQAREFLSTDDSQENVKKIAADCAYGGPAEVMTAIARLEIAEEFLNIGYEDCSKFSDLVKIAAGGGDNFYAFKDIEEGVKTLTNLRFDPADKALLEHQLKQDSFELTYRQPPGSGSLHTILVQMWKKDALTMKLNEMAKDESLVSSRGGGLLDEPDEKSNPASPEVQEEPLKFKPIVDEEANRILVEKLDRDKKAAALRLGADKPAQQITKMALDISSVIENISSNTNMKKLKKAYQDLIKAVEINKEKVL